MAIAQSSVIALSLLYTNKPPSASDLQYWSSPAAAGITWDQAVTAFATSSQAKAVYPYLSAPGIASPTQYVTQIFANAYGIAAADIPAAELTYWANWVTLAPNNYLSLPVVINQYSPPARQAALQNRADVALDFTQKMLAAGSSSFTETQYGNGWAIVNTVTADPATVATAKAANTTFVANGGGQTGTTFTFTTAIDSFQGGATNDTFVGDNGNGAAATVQAADQVNGGGGVDTFKYYAPTTALPSLIDVENIQLFSSKGNALDFSPLAGKGIQNVTFVGSAQNGENVTGLNGITFGVDGVIAGVPNLAADFGTAAAATFAITGSQVGTVKITGTGTTLKTLTVNAEGADDSIADLTNVNVQTLNIAGKGGLTVTTGLSNNFKTIDASKNSGGVALTAGVADLTFTGGTGNDTLTLPGGSFNTKDVLDGGAGKDTLVLFDTDFNPANGQAAKDRISAVNTVKNFETLGLSGGGADVDVSAITAFTDYRLLTNAGNFNVVNASSTNTFTLAVDNRNWWTTIANKLGQDTANLTLEGKGIGASLQLTGMTKINLASVKGSAAAGLNEVVQFGANPDNLNIVVTGDQDLSIASPQALKTGITLDATKFTAKLTANGTQFTDSLTGGTAADVLAGGVGADVLTGGAGADTFSYVNAGDSNAGALTGQVSFDTIKDFDTAADKLKSALFAPANLTAQGTVQAAVNVSGATDLTTAIAVAANAIGANKYGAFQIAGSTYVLGNDGVVATVGAGDLLVQLTGNQTLTATNFTTV